MAMAVRVAAIVIGAILCGCSSPGTPKTGASALSGVPTEGERERMPHSKEATITALLRSTLQDHDVPGIGLVVFDSDRLVIQKAMGLCRLGGKTQITLDSRFHVGSNTKAMTATVIGSLVEDGMLSWHEKAITVFPELAETVHESFRTVTLRQLLTHTAGIQPFTRDVEYDAIPRFSGSPQEQRYQFTRFLLTREPFSPPGKAVEYSNAGYCVAAAMAERVAGKPWEDLMRLRLFERLGLAAGFGWPALSDPEQPWGHRYSEAKENEAIEEFFSRKSGTLAPHPPTDSYRITCLGAPSGDVHLSIVDFAKFAQMHLRGCRGMETILKSETIRFMHQDIQGYALGWVRTGPVSSHNGSATTFYSQAVLYPDLNYGFVLACNAGHARAWDGCAKLAQAVFEEFKDGSLHEQEQNKVNAGDARTSRP